MLLKQNIISYYMSVLQTLQIFDSLFHKIFYKLFACFKTHELSRKGLGLHIKIFALAGVEPPSQHSYKVRNEYFC